MTCTLITYVYGVLGVPPSRADSTEDVPYVTWLADQDVNLLPPRNQPEEGQAKVGFAAS